MEYSDWVTFNIWYVLIPFSLDKTETLPNELMYMYPNKFYNLNTDHGLYDKKEI